jgi:homoserine O-acetyltransferase
VKDLGRAPMSGSVVDPPPATSAWREGDDPGRRQFADVGSLTLENGSRIDQARIAYETWGIPRFDGDVVTNAVLVLHALTGDSHAAGPAAPGHPTPGWWSGLIGPGNVLDTDRFWVVCPNVLGGCQGTTGPASDAPDGRPWGSRWPVVTVRDQVRAERALAGWLGVRRWVLVLGGSMGGMRALEWAVGSPEQVETLAVVATAAAASADQIATQTTQVLAVRSDPAWAAGDYYQAKPGEGPHLGLGLARRIAHLTYRSAAELDRRFGREAQPGEDPAAGGRFAVQSYLDHQADKLLGRFDAGSYVSLTEAMNTHDVGRGRGGIEAALRTVTARTVVVGIDSDRLYPVAQQHLLADLIPGSGPATIVASEHGHDGFLLETDGVGSAVAPLLAGR